MKKIKESSKDNPPPKKTRRPTGHSSKSKRTGRPKLELDEDQILKLAQCGMTDLEMCDLLEISKDTLQRFRPIIQKGRSNLSQSIKRTQLEVALKEKDRTMLIWVGKQYANQKDKQDLEHSGEINSPQVVFYGSNPPKRWKDND